MQIAGADFVPFRGHRNQAAIDVVLGGCEPDPGSKEFNRLSTAILNHSGIYNVDAEPRSQL